LLDLDNDRFSNTEFEEGIPRSIRMVLFTIQNLLCIIAFFSFNFFISRSILIQRENQ